MVGEGIGFAFAVILIWFVLFILIPIGLGIFFLTRFRKRKKREAAGIEPKKKYRGKIFLGLAIALIGFGVLVVSAQAILAQMDMQRINENIERSKSAPAYQERVQTVNFNLYANSTECCFIELQLSPAAKHDGSGYVEFIRHVPGCSSTTYSKCPEKDEVLHVYHFQTAENDTRYFDTDLNKYRFPLSEADQRVLSQTNQYDAVLTYTPAPNDTVFVQRLWDQNVEFPFSAVIADVVIPEEQEKLWERWQMQDKTATDIVKDMHLQYDRNDTIQAIVSFGEPVPLLTFEELLSDYDLKLQFFNFGLTNNSGSLGTNKMHDFSNLTKIIEDKEEYFGEKLTGITRIVANGSAKNYQELLIASSNAGNNMTISEFHILRKIDDNMLQGEELKQRLERATEILSELNETMREQIPWTIVSKSSGQNWYLSVAIDDRVATEPKAVYADRLKKLVGEDIPIVVSFGHVELT